MPLGWNDTLNDLIVLLGGLYTDRDRAWVLAEEVGLDPHAIISSGGQQTNWVYLVREANNRDRVQALIDVVKKDFDTVNLTFLENRLRDPRKALAAPRITEDDWKGIPAVAGGLEKVMGSQPTSLPAGFLETCLIRAKAVARVESPLGVGTAFLIRDNLLITNHRVIPTQAAAHAAKAWFNYEKTVTGADAPGVEFSLDPEAGFATSPRDDWTAVRVKGDPNAEWGMLELTDLAVQVKDFVTIIQHPAGVQNQIRLCNNVVTYTDDRRVQFLTDTMPGLSGSPIFDSNWRVVGLHHSGSWLPQPAANRVYFRNEGIHVRAILDGLRVYLHHGSDVYSSYIEDVSFPHPGSEAWGAMNRRRAELIRKKNRGGLSPEELHEYEKLQRLSRAALERAFPAPTDGDEALARIQARLGITPGESLE